MPLDAMAGQKDRELFKTMQQIGAHTGGAIVHSVEEAVEFANTIGYPVIVDRPTLWEEPRRYLSE